MRMKLPPSGFGSGRRCGRPLRLGDAGLGESIVGLDMAGKRTRSMPRRHSVHSALFLRHLRSDDGRNAKSPAHDALHSADIELPDNKGFSALDCVLGRGGRKRVKPHELRWSELPRGASLKTPRTCDRASEARCRARMPDSGAVIDRDRGRSGVATLGQRDACGGRLTDSLHARYG
jgi:hypothetical protein